MKFKAGDEVSLSATFLRSIDPNAAAGWPSTLDRGIGTVVSSSDCAGTELVHVKFSTGIRCINAFNLVHRKDINLEAHRAEHKPRFSS